MPRRETTPLLASASSNVSSDATGAQTSSSSARGGFRRLFGGGGKRVVATKPRRTRRVDTRKLPGTTTAAATSSRKEPPVKTSTNTNTRSATKIQKSNSKSPPRPLRENTKDSRKKQRPLHVPVRKRYASNPAACDPPAASSLASSSTEQEEEDEVYRAPDAPAYDDMVISMEKPLASPHPLSVQSVQTLGLPSAPSLDAVSSSSAYEVLFARQQNQDEEEEESMLSVPATSVPDVAAAAATTTPVASLAAKTNNQKISKIAAPAAATAIPEKSLPAPSLPTPTLLAAARAATTASSSTARPTPPLHKTTATVASSLPPSVKLRPTTDSGDVAPVPIRNGAATVQQQPQQQQSSMKRLPKEATSQETPTTLESPGPPKNIMFAKSPKPASSLASVNSSNSSAQQSQQQQQPRKPLSKTKALLSRPFGRNSLPPEIARKWVIEVSSAEWDADENRWKYRLLVQRRQLTTDEEQQRRRSRHKKNAPPQHSFTTAFTWRSLADFLWLEGALRNEYLGGLLLPELSSAVAANTTNAAVATVATAPAVAGNNTTIINTNPDAPVEAEQLRHWLSDVMNGVRGQGELIFDHESVDLLRSESMEAFLYKNAGPLAVDMARDEPCPPIVQQEEGEERSFVNKLLSPSTFLADLCVGPKPAAFEMEPAFTHRALACQSRALGTAPSLDVQDSFAEPADFCWREDIVSVGMHTELIRAEKHLALSYHRTAVAAMEKLNVLLEEEKKAGVAWKRFAISLSNLFAYEKDVESARLGDSKAKREHMPFRKAQKNAVDEGLRVLARQKVDRSVPALEALRAMLRAYIADLSSVEASVDVYMEEVTCLSSKQVDSGNTVEKEAAASNSWEGKLKLLASTTIDDMKKQALRSLGSTSTDATTDESETKAVKNSMNAEEKSRLLSNEKLLRQSLTTLCRATPLRMSRMAWRYLNTEASHCALVHSSAAALRTKIDVASRDAVSKMMKRHYQEEKEDEALELSLVERILNLGPGTASREPSAIVEGGNAALEERTQSYRRDKALNIARERAGRWDATLAMAIMDAVGEHDPNVRVEETSRELRMVRKYAIGLRENLNRCVDAVQLLREATIGSKQDVNARNLIESARDEFLVKISKVFSGSFGSTDSEKKISSALAGVLAKSGIDTTDPFGWTQTATSSKHRSRTFTQGRVGDLAHAYFQARDSRIDWLLQSLSDLLKDYYERIEIVEGFVYMECVGIQLEKYFSVKRAKALSAFEKKTDITSAINVAMKKRLTKLLRELENKLDSFGPDVSQTSVKEAKDVHLESKALKAELHGLAMRRLLRARETSTERVIAVMELWAKEEESSSARELKALGEAMTALERSVGKEDFETLVYRFSKRSTKAEA